MARSSKYVAIAFSSLVAVLLVVLSTGTSIPESDLSIDLVATSNTLQGSVATLRLSNHGETTMRVNAYCALYWRNRLGVATNSFFRHDQGYLILHPCQSNFVAVPSPSDAKVWETSFTYEVRPNAIKRLLDRIRFWMPGDWRPDNSFIGRFGPTITNSFPSSNDAGTPMN